MNNNDEKGKEHPEYPEYGDFNVAMANLGGDEEYFTTIHTYVDNLAHQLSLAKAERLAGLDRVMEEAKSTANGRCPHHHNYRSDYSEGIFDLLEDLQTIIDSEKAR